MRSCILIILSLLFVSLHGQNAKLLIKSAEQFSANGFYEDAIEQYNKALEIDPQNGEAYQERARTNEKLNYLDKAADDYKNAAVFGFNPEENFLLSATLCFKLGNLQEAASTVGKVLEIKPKFHEAYLLQCQIYLKQANFKDANIAAIIALETKGTAFAQYLKGVTEFELAHYSIANDDFKKAIAKDKLLLDAYLALANLQLISKETQFAVENCEYVLSIEENNHKAYYLRSRAYQIRRDYTQAISDISKAISLEPSIPEYYLYRGEYYLQSSHFKEAIADLTNVVNTDLINIRALQLRGEAYEKLGQIKNAISDYSLIITLTDETQLDVVSACKQKIFELNRENDRPEIILVNPLLNDNQEAMVPDYHHNLKINVVVKDASLIQLFKINNDTVIFDSLGNNLKEFETTLPSSGLEYITLTAIDIYDNISSVSYAVERFETHAPSISLTNPYPENDSLINLTDNDHFLYIEGQIADENLISSIQIDEVNASYAPRDQNPRFTATIDISKKTRIMLEVSDIYGNISRKQFYIKHEEQTLSDNNPMGKTWVILIENSEYKDFPNLYSPASDIELLHAALSNYQINKVIVKKNLTKREMERFFSIDLRDLAHANNVNSIFIWYAGHGKNINGTGYWIPSDATSNDEFSYFNINALKASLYSYTSLSHILVVSDACETGPGFCMALRGPIEPVACSETYLADKKSAQVFTSAGAGYAFDNSFFTRAFSNVLSNNDDDCSSIDDIAKKVSLIMQTHSTQSPEFGRIPGLLDELGTFFFITR